MRRPRWRRSRFLHRSRVRGRRRAWRRGFDRLVLESCRRYQSALVDNICSTMEERYPVFAWLVSEGRKLQAGDRSGWTDMEEAEE